MGRYGLFRAAAAAGDGGGCLPVPIFAAETALAVIDAAIAAAAFVQLARIHRHNQQHGWTRQKIFHFMIGLCNIVFLVYFMSTIIATCERWLCWVHGCGFVLMASPLILLLASFLLLLSFWVDLCHQTNDEDEEDVRSHRQALLDRANTKPGIRTVDVSWRCCSGIQLGSRQKFVILVLVLSFVVTFAFAILIWVGRGENPIDSSLLKRVYLDVFSVVVLILGGALACYGAVLFSKMSKVRSETVSTEKQKVASLALVSLICFSSSAILALVTDVPVLLYWYSTDADIIYNAVILFLYYFIGSSVPSGFVLWVMKDMPHRQTVERPAQSRVVTLFRERPSTAQDPQWRTAVTSSNKVHQKHFHRKSCGRPDHLAGQLLVDREQPAGGIENTARLTRRCSCHRGNTKSRASVVRRRGIAVSNCQLQLRAIPVTHQQIRWRKCRQIRREGGPQNGGFRGHFAVARIGICFE